MSGLSLLSEGLKDRPGLLAGIYRRSRLRWRARFPTLSQRIRGVALIAMERFVGVCVAWGAILYSLNALGTNVITNPGTIDLRSGIVFVAQQVYSYLSRGRTDPNSGWLGSFFSAFTPVTELSWWGGVLAYLMWLSIPVLTLSVLNRFWKWTRPENNGD